MIMITVQAVFKPTMHCEYYGGQSLNPKKLSWGSNRQPLDNKLNVPTTPPWSTHDTDIDFFVKKYYHCSGSATK